MTDFLMPSLGADMESGTLVEWLVKPGSEVRTGDVVAVVETHKGAIEVEIFDNGMILELCAQEGEEVPVGGLLARLAHPAEAAETMTDQKKPVRRTEAKAARKQPEGEAPSRRKEAPKPAVIPKEALEPSGAPPPTARAKVTPAARRRAAELGIDADVLEGTGVDGSVTLADIEAAGVGAKRVKPATRAAARPRGGFDHAEMRQAIAAAMSRSKREIPHYYLGTTVDMGAALAWLESHNRDRPPDERILPAILMLKAAALALREVPQLNGYWEEGGFRAAERVNIGWAIRLRGGGLIAPAIRDVDTMALPDLMEALRDLVGRARGGGLRSSELTDPSFTVTSLGDRGAEEVIGVIYPPQVAVLGIGRTVERPWVADGKVVARPVASVWLSGDHRASDGHTGGLFLSSFAGLLQEPDTL